MKKCKLFLLPIFCLLLSGCDLTPKKQDNNEDDQPAEVTNNAKLNITAKSIKVDETFTLIVSSVPTGMTPSWSIDGDSVTTEVNPTKSSAVVKGVAVGTSTVKVTVGEKELSCQVVVSKKEEVRQRLATPVINLNTAKNGLVWSVTGALGYTVQVNDGAATPQETGTYTFSVTPGEYTVTVIAKADIPAYDSLPATFSYETKTTGVGELTFDNDEITWASYVGLGIEAKFGTGSYTQVISNKVSATEDGIYTLHAIAGYDEMSHIYYVEGVNSERQITVKHSSRLVKPQYELNEEGNGIKWLEVEGATGYSIQVNSNPVQTTLSTEHLFSSVPGDYTVTIIALAEAEEYNSLPEVFEYHVAYTAIGNLSIEGNKVVCDGFAGTHLEYKINDGDFAAVTEDGVTIRKAGTYTFKSVAGYLETSSTYFVDSNSSVNTKEINVAAPEKVIIENGAAPTSEDLMEQYKIQKYSDGWADTAAFAKIDNVTNEDYTEGNCVALKYWRNYVDFRFSKSASFMDSYDTISLAAKGDGQCNFRVQIAIAKDVSYGEIRLTGVYATYTVSSALSSDWTIYKISMADAGWRISYGGQTYNPTQIESMLKMKFSEFLTYFDTFNFLLKKGDSDNKETFIYVDDVEFTNEHAETSSELIIPPVKMRSGYSLQSDSISGQVKFADGYESAILTYYEDGAVINLPLTSSLDDNQLTLTSETAEKDFVLTLSTINGGASWTLVSVTGSLAGALNNISLGEMIVVQDFSSYSSTGVGYDKTHTAEEATGLRAAYYCDYYYAYNNDDTNIQSPVGGPNWWLMGSDDYIMYQANGCLTDGAMSLRSSTGWRNMRYMSASLAFGAEPIARGVSKMSIRVKGATNRDVTIAIYAYYRNSIAPATQQSDRTGGADIVIPQNSDWTEYSIALDSSKTYYGYSIIVKSDNSNSGATSAHISVDDIIMYR